MDVWQFVDSIASSPTVRLDLNDDVTWAVDYDGTDWSPPELRRAESQSLLADGGPVPSSAYGNRIVRLRLDLLGSSVNDLADRMQTLMRELDRPSNLLKFQPGTAAPVFFRCMRSEGTRIIDYPGGGKLRTLDVEVLAEPAAYGLEETVGPWTVSNNPAAASNGMFFDVTGIKGDLDAPLHLVVSTGVVGTGRRWSALAVRRRGTPSAAPMLLQAEAMTQGTDTTVQANNAAMSGSGSNYSRISFGTQTGLTQRLSIAKFPSVASVDARGTYRVLARVRQNQSGDLIDLRLRWGSPDSPITNSVVRHVGGSGVLRWVDLTPNSQLVQIPAGYDPGTRLNGVEVATEGVYLALDARRASGAGTVDVDALMLLPADDRQEFIRWPEAATGAADLYVEGGVRPAVYARNASGQVVSAPPSEIVGGGMMISPGRTNRIYMMRDVGSTASGGDDVAATTTISGTYHPRYLRPATS